MEETQSYISLIIRTGAKSTKKRKEKQDKKTAQQHKTKQSGRKHEAPRVKTSGRERQRRRKTRKREGSGQDV